MSDSDTRLIEILDELFTSQNTILADEMDRVGRLIQTRNALQQSFAASLDSMYEAGVVFSGDGENEFILSLQIVFSTGYSAAKVEFEGAVTGGETIQ